MLDPFILDAMADSVVGFTLSYRDLPPHITKRARDFTNALYSEVDKLNSKYDEVLGIKQNKPLQARATT